MGKIEELEEALVASEELRHRAVTSISEMNKVLRDEIAALKSAGEALRWVEWSGMDDCKHSCCPCCHEYKEEGHAAGCFLGRALGGEALQAAPVRIFYSPSTEQLLASSHYDETGIIGPYSDVTSEIDGYILQFDLEFEEEVTEINYEY